MADQKVSDLPSLNGVDVDAADLLYIVDSSAGTAGSKKITVGQYQQAAYSAGTANGVMYLNGSNVVTTGSGLVFDGSNLGIGTSSPGVKLEASSAAAILRLRTSTARGGGNGYMDFYDPTGRKGYFGYGGGDDAFYLANEMNAPMLFLTNNTERARITGGGDLLVGTTTTPSSSNAGFAIPKDADGTYLRNACTITSSRTHFEFVNGNGTVGSISTNASATAFNTSSDRRLKENIHPAGDAASVIDAIEVVQHDWKAGGHTRFGVIAQDLHAVAPEAVTPGDDGDEIEKTWGVDYSKLVPMLIKEIQSLRARVAALEQA